MWRIVFQDSIRIWTNYAAVTQEALTEGRNLGNWWRILVIYSVQLFVVGFLNFFAEKEKLLEFFWRGSDPLFSDMAGALLFNCVVLLFSFATYGVSFPIYKHFIYYFKGYNSKQNIILLYYFSFCANTMFVLVFLIFFGISIVVQKFFYPFGDYIYLTFNVIGFVLFFHQITKVSRILQKFSSYWSAFFVIGLVFLLSMLIIILVVGVVAVGILAMYPDPILEGE